MIGRFLQIGIQRFEIPLSLRRLQIRPGSANELAANMGRAA